MNYTIEVLTFDDLVLENEIMNVDKDSFVYKEYCPNRTPCCRCQYLSRYAFGCPTLVINTCLLIYGYCFI